MKKGYSTFLQSVLSLMFAILLNGAVQSQTITVGPNPPFDGTALLAGKSNISFVVENTNAYAINITGIANFCNLSENNSVWALYASNSSISGVSGNMTASPAWTLVATSSPTSVVTPGITQLNFPSLNFSIASNTRWRFALQHTSANPSSIRYTWTGTPIATNSFTRDGVNLYIGDYRINNNAVGYAGTNNTLTQQPRYFTGSINFIPAIPCVNPVYAGNTLTTANFLCANQQFTLSLDSTSTGLGLSYQWQISTDSTNWTDISGANSTRLSTSQVNTHFYRCKLVCSGGTPEFSTPVRVNTPPLANGTYTINRNAPASSTNVTSFNEALDLIRCGISGPVTFNVVRGSGPYIEQMIVTPVNGMSATNTVTFNGNGDTIRFASTNTNERAVIKLRGADHFRFRNLVVNASGTSNTEFGFGFHLINDADSNQITNCTILIDDIFAPLTSTQYAGIAISGAENSANGAGTNGSLCDGNLIRGNKIIGGNFGITCIGTSVDAVRQNVISRNEIQDFYTTGIQISGNFGIQVDSNIISRPTRTNAAATVNGIAVTQLNTLSQISRNTLTNPFGGNPGLSSIFNGISFSGTDATNGFENRVFNNQFLKMNGSGEINAIFNSGSDNVLYFHNTILLDGEFGTAGTRGFYQTNAASGIRFENNIISIIRGGSGIKHAIYYNTDLSDILSDHNLFYLNSPGGNQNIGFAGAFNHASLLDWRNATQDDTSSFYRNPLFSDVFNGNLRPNSPLIDNIGVPVGVSNDLVGEARSATTPDVGAYEFTPAPCTTPPVSGNTYLSLDSICEGTSVIVGLTGNSVGLGQTYIWQSSPDSAGTYNDLGNALNYPDSVIVATSTLYYRCAVICGASVTYSEPVLLTVFPALPTGTYTINPNLTGQPNNYDNFTQVKSALECGITGPVVFNVDSAAGPYNEQFILGSIAGASSTNTITFNGNGATLQYLATNTNERAVIKLNGADHVRFNNLRVEALADSNAVEFGFGIQLINDADSNEINGCTIQMYDTTFASANYAGIVISSSNTSAINTGNAFCDANKIVNNTIINGNYGITCVGSTAEANRFNVISGNRILDFGTYGIYISGNFFTLIDSNIISRPTRKVFAATSNAIHLTSLSQLLNITRNTITNPFGGLSSTSNTFNGIMITGVDAQTGLENYIINNKIYGLNSNGEINGINNTGSDNAIIDHNTIHIDGDLGDNVAARGFYQTTSAAGILFRNNNIYISRGGTGKKTGIHFNTTASDITSNNNNVYLVSPTGNQFFGFSNGNDRATLTDWQTANPTNDANSLSVNPIFVDLISGNLKPSNTAIDNKGTPVNVLTDIENNFRSTLTPDIGAYEFSPSVCTAPPTAGNTAVTPLTVCAGTQINLRLTNFSVGLSQTYQWQFSTSATGPFTDLGTPLSNPDTAVVATQTGYYRCALTCSGLTEFSVPALSNVNVPLPAGTYTIDSRLPFVPGSNYPSFVDVRNALNCGITGPVVFNVAVGSGPYNEQFILNSVIGSSATNTITFNGNNETIRFSSNSTADRAVIKLRGTDHVRFNEFVVDADGIGTFGYGFQLLNGADSNIIRKCIIKTNSTLATVTASNYVGIVINGSETQALTGTTSFNDGNLIDSNSINGGQFGVAMVGTFGDQINNNRITRNTITDFNQAGIVTSSNDSMVISENDFYRPRRNPASAVSGILVQTRTTNSLIEKNRIHNMFDGDLLSTNTFTGININGADGEIGLANTVANNLIYDVRSEGIMYGLYNQGGNFWNFYHNTVAIEDFSQTGNSPTYGFYQTADANNIQFRNNMIYVARSGSGSKFGIYYNTPSSQIATNNNNYYLPTLESHIGFLNGNRTTLNDWRQATSQEQNSLNFDPIFASPQTANFTPLFPGVDNGGANVGIATDILNNSRNLATPDMGAFEFTAPPCTTPPAVDSATAIPNSGICIEAEVDLSITGYVFGGGQTYQWERSTDLAGPWVPMGGARVFPDTTILADSTSYFRCIVTCGAFSSTSVPIKVTLNTSFLGGTYTINPDLNVPADFRTFNAAVAALECGITGPVFFDVAPATYSEQVRMKKIPGSSPINRVTFRSATGNPASVILTYLIDDPTKNYVLRLDSASHVTYKNMTINTTNGETGRVVELANLASKDSIVGCIIEMPEVGVNSNNVTGIFANNLRGRENVFMGNTIRGGSHGILVRGIAVGNYSFDHVIDSNTFERQFAFGIFNEFTSRIRVTRNNITMSEPHALPNSYGIFANQSDSAYSYSRNKIRLEDAVGGTVHGIFLQNCDAGVTRRASVNANIINGVNLQSSIYGLNQNGSVYNNTTNNVIAVEANSVVNAYGSNLIGGGGVRFHNNSILNTSTTTGLNNAAANFAQTSIVQPPVNIQNNIFTNEGGGRAMQVNNTNFIYSNYNMFYTSGPTLVQNGFAGANANLQAWANSSFWDLQSIVYAPTFADPLTLKPDLNSPEVWAMHGRGVQIEGNDRDFNDSIRPTTLTAGVPDLGAYEFLPNTDPTLLDGVPAVPTPGSSQYFMYGTDTVMTITYDASAPVPASIQLRRFSGVLPTGLSAGQQPMYFYNQLIAPAGNYKYTVRQNYIDPWRGFIPTESMIKVGYTDTANNWQASNPTTIDIFENLMRDTSVRINFDRFTGLAGDPNIAPLPPYISVTDSSNRGTRFWVPYGHHYSFSFNAQNMWLYLSAQDSANVTVRVNGTNWVRNYAIPAGTVRVSDIMPKTGLIDARITDEGLFERGISIISDVPIEAYAHIYDGATSGATMLMPVGVYGYEYLSLNNRQFYPSGGAGSFNWFAIISDRDSTLVEITPTTATRGGRPAGVPFQVYLNRGEVYNVMGTQVASGAGSDLTGSSVKAVANASGKCYPFAFFSGSSRTSICYFSNGDNFIQQVFPSQAWGRKYSSFATANSNSNTGYNSNLYRVLVRDTTTEVKFNGNVLPRTQLNLPGKFYQVSTTSGNGRNGAVLFESDKPVLVAQYMVSTSANECAGISASGDGDPEMIYISPIEQGIKKASFYSTDRSAIRNSYLNLVIPTNGITSLLIDGSNAFTDVFAHPFLPGYSCVRKNFGGGAGQHTVSSDSAFTAITYGLGSVESYGYNAGTLVKNLASAPSITNTLGEDSVSSYTCENAPFRFNINITTKPQQIYWLFSQVPSLSPNADVVQDLPTPVDSSIINGRWYYKYVVPTSYTFTAPGTYQIPIIIKDTVAIEGCENTRLINLEVRVLPAPKADFNINFSGCLGEPVIVEGTGNPIGGAVIRSYNWNYGNGQTGTGQRDTATYSEPGTYNINLRLVSTDGCVADTTKPLTINPLPPVEVVEDTILICVNDPANFSVDNPNATYSYKWYTDTVGGTQVGTGPTYTIPSLTQTSIVWVEATSADGCNSKRKKVTAIALFDIDNPVVTLDTAGFDFVRFEWAPVTGATRYEISTDNGVTWQTPSSGPLGTTHTINGLRPSEGRTIIVRAIGGNDCQKSDSDPFTGRALPGKVFIANAFSPNGDGLNDIFIINNDAIQRIQFAVYNQWGEKVFETTDPTRGWNGSYKGKTQPSGVYMYVARIEYFDGKVETRKGTINLIR